MKRKISFAVTALLLVLGIGGMATSANGIVQETTTLQQNNPDCRYPPCDPPCKPGETCPQSPSK